MTNLTQEKQMNKFIKIHDEIIAIDLIAQIILGNCYIEVKLKNGVSRIFSGGDEQDNNEFFEKISEKLGAVVV